MRMSVLSVSVRAKAVFISSFCLSYVFCPQRTFLCLFDVILQHFKSSKPLMLKIYIYIYSTTFLKWACCRRHVTVLGHLPSWVRKKKKLSQNQFDTSLQDTLALFTLTSFLYLAEFATFHNP